MSHTPAERAEILLMQAQLKRLSAKVAEFDARITTVEESKVADQLELERFVTEKFTAAMALLASAESELERAAAGGRDDGAEP